MFTTAEYKNGLLALQNQIKESQLALLCAQYAMPERTASSRQLAAAIGYTNHQPINWFYGTVGHMLCEILGRYPQRDRHGEYQWWQALSSGRNSKEYGFLWTLHPSLAQALEELGIVVVQDVTLPEELTDEMEYYEGTAQQIVVNKYERNRAARQACISHYGAQCVVCGFDFEATYGEIGIGYIHVHHLRPLSEINEKYVVDPINDLRPVCPNCHAMIHRKIPPYSIVEIQAMLEIGRPLWL
jgi:5-methylcytosine-specific restriction protein A